MPDPELRIGIPASLGLSEEETQALSERLQSHLVEVLKGTQAEKIISARPQTIEKSQSIKIKAQVEV